MSNSNNGSIWPIVWVIVGIAVVLQLFSGNSGSTTTTTTAPVRTDSFEYRYAKERFKQEGFNSSDADTAARAVIKFNEAQKAR